jgi:hypothetical protein
VNPCQPFVDVKPLPGLRGGDEPGGLRKWHPREPGSLMRWFVDGGTGRGDPPPLPGRSWQRSAAAWRPSARTSSRTIMRRRQGHRGQPTPATAGAPHLLQSRSSTSGLLSCTFSTEQVLRPECPPENRAGTGRRR